MKSRAEEIFERIEHDGVSAINDFIADAASEELLAQRNFKEFFRMK